MGIFGGKKLKEKYQGTIKVTLTKSGIIIRLVFLVLFLAIASYAFYDIFTKVLHTKGGWQTVTADTKSPIASEYVFYYQFGVSGASAAEEWAKLNKLYPTLLNQAAEYYGDDEVAGLGNLHQLNSRPNEEVYIEPTLMDALKKIQKFESRLLFYAPVYAQYRALFSCADEYAAVDFDPRQNEELAAYLQKVCDYVKDDNHIRIEITGEHTAKLVVSQEYMAFAKENEIERYLDLYTARNAFIIDYVADNLIESGYTKGVITSAEGYTRALGEDDYSIKRSIYNTDGTVTEMVYHYNGPKSLCVSDDFVLASINRDNGLLTEENTSIFEEAVELGCSDLVLSVLE